MFKVCTIIISKFRQWTDTEEKPQKDQLLRTGLALRLTIYNPYKTRIGTHRHIGAFFYADRILDLNL